MLQGLKPYDAITLKNHAALVSACQLLWLPTPTDLIWMTGVAYLTIFGHTCCSVVGHSQSRRRRRETIKRYDVTETYSHVVRQNLQKRKLRVLNPARINVFYWFNWLNLIGS